MSGDRENRQGLAKMAGVGLGVCCGLPLLIGAGFFVGVAGIGLSSWLTLVAGLAIVLGGVWFRRKRLSRCDLGDSPYTERRAAP